MLIQILKGTPPWVFALFFALLAIGFLQSRPRSISRPRLAILPAVFIAYSLYGTVAAFGAQPAALVAWAAAVGTAVLLNRWLRQPSNARWEPSTGSFHVPGSWTPLALMMAIFFTKYVIAVALAMRPQLHLDPVFAASAAFAYGLASGTFLARALHVLALRPAPGAHSVQST